MFEKFKTSRMAAAGPAQTIARPRRAIPLRNSGSWVFWLLLVVCALCVGIVAGLDSPMIAMVVGGGMFSLMMFILLDINGMLLVLFVLTFVVQGSLLFFLGMRSATWVAIGMAGLFFMRALLELGTRAAPKSSKRDADDNKRTRVGDAAGAGFVMIALGSFVACYFFSWVVNHPGLGQTVSSIKATLPMMGILFAFFFFRWKNEEIERFWWLILGIALFQLPVVMYQHFFVASKRLVQGFDSVVGTFGGSYEAGGLNSLLVLFVIAAVMYVLARWNRGLSGRLLPVSFFFVGMAIILLGEVKAAFVWLPLAMFIILRRRVTKNIVTVVAYAMLASVLMGGIYFAYKTLYWGAKASTGSTVQERLDNAGGYFFDPHNINYVTGEVSRGASLAIWAHDAKADIPKRLFGFGPGASKSVGVVGKGVVAKRYAPLNIDSTTLVVLLWDEGILGALTFCIMPIFAIFAGWRFIVRDRGSPAQLAIVETSVAMTILFLSMLIYNRTLIDEPAVQLLYMFCMGCIVQRCRYEEQATPSPNRAVPCLGKRLDVPIQRTRFALNGGHSEQ